MKHYTFFLLFFVIILPFSMSLAMDDPYKTISLEPLADPFEERITLANDTINRKLKHKDPLTVAQRQHSLTEKKAFSIIQLVVNLPENTIDKLFIKELMKKNIFFEQAINYYYHQAIKNINHVTGDTLEAVSNYNAPQPVKQLDKLPRSIKEFVMKKAYAQITCLYNIVFKGHTDIIEAIDSNASSDLAASASKDGTFRLWRLSSGKYLYTLPEIAYQGYVKFNKDGSQLATASLYKAPTKIRICIWDTLSQKLLYHMKHKDLITHLHFFPNSEKTSIIIVVSQQNNQSLYELKKDTPAILLGNITHVKTKKESRLYATEIDNYQWVITKNSHRLGLCQQALHKTKNETSMKIIKTTTPYAKLTDYEKDIFEEQLEQKSDYLVQKKHTSTLRTLLG